MIHVSLYCCGGSAPRLDPQCNKEPCPLLFSSQDNRLFDSTSSNGGCCSIKRASIFLEKKKKNTKHTRQSSCTTAHLCTDAPAAVKLPQRTMWHVSLIHLGPVNVHLHQQTLLRVWGSMFATHVQDSCTNTSYRTNNTFLM